MLNAEEIEREHARELREQERARRERERTIARENKQNTANAKLVFKEALANTKVEYETRCNERASLRQKYIKEVLK